MNISSEEALSLLEVWRKASTPLRVHVAGREFPATIGAIEGTVVSIATESEHLKLDVQGADFNGDSGAGSLNAGGYLVCEFRNDDRCSFYVSPDTKTA